MAFGYTLLRGKREAAGYIQKTGGKRTVFVRGMKPDENCGLYVLTENGAALCTQKTAGPGGQVQLETDGAGTLFVAADGGVRLWEGDDEAFLRACAYLEAQRKTVPSFSREKQTEKREDTQKEGVDERTEQKNTENSPQKKEGTPQTAGKEGPLYALRAPGRGEPVDALPER